ncbi:glucokinase [Psychromonas marina]|uniref:Glucokinase n=1 Tax=Psychromonas marina TaxID=88364 RepID=A0ABQ6E2Y8_9GAMM|nr:ROK family protein [Psychromonas marina]GLS91565.1 glucokinase [Psychromonas marina]
MKHYLSFDIGGTQIKFAVLTEHGEMVEKNSMDTAESGTQIISDIVSVKTKLAEKYTLEGVAFSMPGFVDVNSGFLKTAGAIDDFFGINFKNIMVEKLSLPVELENDVNCVALAEKWLGGAKHCEDFICITIGTGVGGAICVNGELVRGHSYMAGEFGYMLTQNIFKVQDKERSTMSHSASVGHGLIKKYCNQQQVPLENMSGMDIYRLAEQGDQVALKVIEEFYQNIAIGLYNLTFILNPKKILIGGAISGRDEIFPAIKAKFQEVFNGHALLNQFLVDEFVCVESTQFKNDSGLIGALYHFLQMTMKRK